MSGKKLFIKVMVLPLSFHKNSYPTIWLLCIFNVQKLFGGTEFEYGFDQNIHVFKVL